MNTIKTILGVCLAAGTLSFNSQAAQKAFDPAQLPPAAATKGLTFAKDIKPLFDQSCIKCHGDSKQKGGLRLDSLEAALKGGEDGKVIIPGNSGKSPLAYAIARVNKDLSMPPEGKAEPLTKDQVGLVRAWIDQGAK